MGCSWGAPGSNEEEGEFPVDLELFTGFQDSNGNDLFEHDTIWIEQEPHSVVWSVEKGMWVAETDVSEVALVDVANQSTFAGS
jgi:hypothetical protein